MQNRVEKLFMATHSRPPTDQEMQRILAVANALECKKNDAFIGVIAALETYSTAYDSQINKITKHCDEAAHDAAKKAADSAEAQLLKQQAKSIEKIADRIHFEHSAFKSWYVYGCTIVVITLLTFGGIWAGVKEKLEYQVLLSKEQQLIKKEAEIAERENSIEKHAWTIKILEASGFAVYDNAIVLPYNYESTVKIVNGKPAIYTK